LPRKKEIDAFMEVFGKKSKSGGRGEGD
jgi:hypothetical protein